MPAFDIAVLAAMIFAAAVIYSSVGQAGASGYIAAMALMGLSPAVMKPTALALNILVAALATYRWHSAGLVPWRALVPLVVTSVPFAFIGGALELPGHWYRALVGVVLLIAGIKLLIEGRTISGDEKAERGVPWLGGMLTGSLVGVLSGLTGTGGGVFLSPILLFFGWAGARQGAGITVPLILVNSIAGLAGNVMTVRHLPAELAYLVVAALIGAVVGTQLGLRWASPVVLQRILGALLIIAAGTFVLT